MIHLQRERGSEESEDIQMCGIDVDGGWRTARRSHPNAEYPTGGRTAWKMCMECLMCQQNERVHGQCMVNQTMMYGAEKLGLKKAQGNKLEVAELRWVCRVTKFDRILNENGKS